MALRAPKPDFVHPKLVTNDRPVDPNEAIQLAGSTFHKPSESTETANDCIPSEKMERGETLKGPTLIHLTKLQFMFERYGFNVYDKEDKRGLSLYKRENGGIITLFCLEDKIEISIHAKDPSKLFSFKMEIFGLLIKSGYKMVDDHYEDGIKYYRIEKFN